MTPEQALAVVAQMVARAHATKADHLAAEQALVVLRQALNGTDDDDTG